MNNLLKLVQEQIKTVIIGKDEQIAKVLMAILAKGHILLEDVPGVGKTTMAIAFAKALGLDTKRVQFTPDTMPSDIIGFSIYNKNTGKLEYQEGTIMTNLVLADEINRTSSKTQSALLEAMEEKNVTVDGVTYELPFPFIVLATQNPVGSAGTQMLPNSQLDRFLIKMSMGYPGLSEQANILQGKHKENPMEKVQEVITRDELASLIDQTNAVYIKDELFMYISKLVQATRDNENVELGVSPRGALALCNMAKAHAFVLGRDYVIPDDVQEVFMDVCAHRLLLSSRAKLNDYTPEKILPEILESVEMPVIDDIRDAKKRAI